MIEIQNNYNKRPGKKTESEKRKQREKKVNKEINK